MDRAKSSSYWMASLKTKVRVLKKFLVGESWIDFFSPNCEENALKEDLGQIFAQGCSSIPRESLKQQNKMD